MKSAFLLLCLAVASCAALPTQVSHSSLLDLLIDLEDVVEEDGKIIMEKMVNVIHHVQNSILNLIQLIPKTHEKGITKMHHEALNILDGLEEVTKDVRDLLDRQKAYFGFDLLGGLTELTGGTKLSTVLKLISLADKAHKVMDDAKQFVPHLEETLNKMQSRVEEHVNDFASHVLKELGLQDVVARSMVKQIEDLFTKVEDEAHVLILDLLHKMEQTFDILKEKLPEEYEKVKERVEEVRADLHELIVEVEKTLVMRSFTLLDLAGNLSGNIGGHKMSTAFKVMSLLDKFNTVVQDVKNFGPKAETLLQHSVKKVANSAQDFFTHAAGKLLE